MPPPYVFDESSEAERDPWQALPAVPTTLPGQAKKVQPPVHGTPTLLVELGIAGADHSGTPRKTVVTPEDESARSGTERSVAERHVECPLCFEPLHSGPVGVLVDSEGARVTLPDCSLERPSQNPHRNVHPPHKCEVFPLYCKSNCNLTLGFPAYVLFCCYSGLGEPHCRPIAAHASASHTCCFNPSQTYVIVQHILCASQHVPVYIVYGSMVCVFMCTYVMHAASFSLACISLPEFLVSRAAYVVPYPVHSAPLTPTRRTLLMSHHEEAIFRGVT